MSVAVYLVWAMKYGEVDLDSIWLKKLEAIHRIAELRSKGIMMERNVWLQSRQAQ